MDKQVLKFSHYGDKFIGRYGDLEGRESCRAYFNLYEVDANGNFTQIEDHIHHQIYIPVDDPDFQYDINKIYEVVIDVNGMWYSEDKFGNKNYSRFLISEISMEMLMERMQQPISPNNVGIEKILRKAMEDQRWELDKRLGRPYQLPSQKGKPEENDESAEENSDDLPF